MWCGDVLTSKKWHDFGTKVWIFIFIAFLEKLEHLQVIWHISVFFVWSFSTKKSIKKIWQIVLLLCNKTMYNSTYIYIIVQIEFYAFSHIKCFLFSLNISIYLRTTYSKIHYFDIFMHKFQLKIRKLDTTYFKITLLIFIWKKILSTYYCVVF